MKRNVCGLFQDMVQQHQSEGAEEKHEKLQLEDGWLSSRESNQGPQNTKQNLGIRLFTYYMTRTEEVLWLLSDDFQILEENANKWLQEFCLCGHSRTQHRQVYILMD